MPKVRGLPADGVRRVPLLQRHEEVWGPWAHEAELHHAAVHCSEYDSGFRDLGGLRVKGPILPSMSSGLVTLLLENVLATESPELLPWG